MNNKGQAVMSEYVMIFFVVIAAAVAMTMYVQRALEARIHAARNFMIQTVNNSGACDANCLHATGGNIWYGYEPYYTETVADIQQGQTDTTGATTGNPKVLGGKYLKSLNEDSSAVSTTLQLPPGCADGVSPKPAYCG